MKKLLVLTALMMIAAVTTQAAVAIWTGDLFSGGDGDYANGQSWTTNSGVSAYGMVPQDTDSHGLISFIVTAIAPTISSPILQAPAAIGVGWDLMGSGELNIVDGGSINAVTLNVPFGQAGGPTNVGVINMSGGTLTASDHLYLGGGSGPGIGIINQSGGLIHVNNIGLIFGLGDGAGIFLSDSAQFWIEQDFTGLDLVAIGWISTPDVGKQVAQAYEGTTMKYWVIPEPATLGLIAILGLAFLRRK